MNPALLLILLLGADPDLAAAERAIEAGNYQDAGPALERAAPKPLSAGDRKRLFELQAVTAAAFGDNPRAIQAFRQLLDLDPTYLPEPTASPKLVALFAQARSQGPLKARAPVPAAALPAPAQAPPAAGSSRPFDAADGSSPLYRRWWFWAGVGAVAAGAAAATWYGLAPSRPEANLGTGSLP